MYNVSSGRTRDSSLYQLITSTYWNMTPITEFLYKLYLLLFSSFFTRLGANYPPPSQILPFATVRTWLFDILCRIRLLLSWIMLHLNIIKYINDICFVLFTLGDYYCFSPCSFMTGCMDGNGVFAQNRTLPPNQTVCYVSIILTIVVLTEI